MQNHKFNLTYFFVVFLIILGLQEFFLQSQTTTVPYSEFEEVLANGKVKEVVISENEVRAVLTEPRESDRKQVLIAKKVETDMVERLEKHNIKYWRVIESTFWRDVLGWLLPFAFFIAIWVFISKKMMSGGAGGSFMSIGKSKAKVYVEKDINVKFDDVAGVDEAKDELDEVIKFLKNPDQYGRLGAKMPRGILLVGPPGTGKTLLAKAVAGEAKVPFFSISGSEFVEMFVGVGAARVRDLFEQARKQAPCIIFIDELDALGKARGNHQFGGGHDEKEQTLNQLLVELDGFDTTLGVVLLAATNRPEILDPALLRSGRFDRQVLVDRPDKQGRLQILKVHIKKVKMEENVDLEQVAALTTGFTGADLANLVNEAALSATRNDCMKVTLKDFNLAIKTILAGLEKKSRVLNQEEREIVAFHEMGHALVASTVESTNKVHKVSIIPRGIGALGYTIQRPTEDRYLMSEQELRSRMQVLLGGRAAEQLIFERMSTGSSDDIGKATEVARSIVTQYGMISELGHVAWEKKGQTFLGGPSMRQHEYSEKTAELIDNKIKQLMDEAFDDAFRLLEKNRNVLVESAEELLKTETLNESELQGYFDQIQTTS
jgi:cell division protease FtsH